MFAGSVEGTEEAVYRFTLNPLVVVGVDRRGRADRRRADHDVAGRRRFRRAEAKQAGYEVQLAGAGSEQ